MKSIESINVNSITENKLYFTGEGYLNAIEFAILLRNEKAIEILHRYNRNTLHTIKRYSTIKSDYATNLAIRYECDDIVQQLQKYSEII